MIDIYPQKCNLCGGDVIYTSNKIIYGKEYGSGKCYFCTSCKAYVGTHKPRPSEALGILSNKEMRDMKIKCHEAFDQLWSNRKERNAMYKWLASEMDISEKECHFGYFNLEQLINVYEILTSKKDD